MLTAPPSRAAASLVLPGQGSSRVPRSSPLVRALVATYRGGRSQLPLLSTLLGWSPSLGTSQPGGILAVHCKRAGRYAHYAGHSGNIGPPLALRYRDHHMEWRRVGYRLTIYQSRSNAEYLASIEQNEGKPGFQRANFKLRAL